MYDFQGVLDQANEAFQNKDYAQAAYYYWKINFAYEDEEFPISYTRKIGGDAQEGFERTMRLISVEDILSSDFCRTYQKYFGNSPHTKKYFVNFERDIVKYAIDHPRKSHSRKRNRHCTLFVIAAIIIALLVTYIYHRTLPKTIASTPNGICKFFELT